MDAHFIKNGIFQIDGVRIEDIVSRYDTPLYLYSAGVIASKYRRFVSQFPGFEVFYSFKANPNLAICRKLHALGACADVSSLGELRAALRVGFDPNAIVFVGPGKTEREIEAAITTGIYAIAAESVDELLLIDSLCRKTGRPIDILLRINTLEEPISPEMMVGGPSKFGFDEETVVGEVSGTGLRTARLAGIHVYSASQVLDSGFIAKHLEYVMNLARRLSDEIGFNLRCIDFGGGFGVPYRDGESELDTKPIAERAAQVRQQLGRSHPDCRLIFEVGRFMVAESGIFVTRALRVKRSRETCFVITDGGMNHFSRPVFMGVNHPVRILNKTGAEPNTLCSIAGPICTPIDVIGKNVLLPRPEPGDIIGILGAGAYGYTMSMVNFMSLGSPAEVMVENGKAHIIRERKSAESLFEEQNLTE